MRRDKFVLLSYLNQMKKVFRSALCACVAGFVLASCEPVIGGDEALVVSRPDVFILCEGLYQANNAEVSAYNSNLMWCTSDYYFQQNGQYLGDTGQDILYHDGYLYVSVSGSKYIAKLDLEGREVARRSITPEEGDPRYLAAKGDYLYVTLYSGRVAKMNTSDLSVVDYAPVGNNPEGIVVYKDQLLVANSGWANTTCCDSTLTIIDIETFEPVGRIEVEHNPQSLVVAGDSVYLLAYGKNYVTTLQSINVVERTARTITYATNAAAYEGTLYLCNSVTDWVTYETSNTFFTYDVATATLNTANCLQGDVADVASNSVYMMEVDPQTGELYIGLAGNKFVSSGKVYRYTSEGVLVDDFNVLCNPNQAVFVERIKG